MAKNEDKNSDDTFDASIKTESLNGDDTDIPNAVVGAGLMNSTDNPSPLLSK